MDTTENRSHFSDGLEFFSGVIIKKTATINKIKANQYMAEILSFYIIALKNTGIKKPQE